jgi:hypothetical protein
MGLGFCTVEIGRNPHELPGIYKRQLRIGSEMMKVKVLPRDEVFLGLAVGSAVLLVEISDLALLAH